MRIDIIHRRDPDSGCDHEVYLDGVKVNADVWDFDPGAGCEMSEFEDNAAEAVAEAPDYLKERIAAIYEEMKPTYERWGY